MYISLLSATQIITESLPISSSTHGALMARLADWCGWETFVVPSWFDYLLHGPTIVILILFFRKTFWQFMKDYRSAPEPLALTLPNMIVHMVVASVAPVIMMYGLIKPYVSQTGWYHGSVLPLIGLSITAGLLLWLNRCSWQRKTPTLATAMIVGLVQACALLPGISRFASTYVVAARLGLAPAAAFMYSFALGMPLFVGGFLLGLRDGYGIWHGYFTVPVLITWICATVLGYGALWGMWHLSERKRLWIMGWYMLVPISILVLLSVWW